VHRCLLLKRWRYVWVWINNTLLRGLLATRVNRHWHCNWHRWGTSCTQELVCFVGNTINQREMNDGKCKFPWLWKHLVGQWFVQYCTRCIDLN
jgi:hypothetical protein